MSKRSTLCALSMLFSTAAMAVPSSHANQVAGTWLTAMICSVAWLIISAIVLPMLRLSLSVSARSIEMVMGIICFFTGGWALITLANPELYDWFDSARFMLTITIGLSLIQFLIGFFTVRHSRRR